MDRLKERGLEKGSDQHSTLQGREWSVLNKANIGTVSKATLGRLLRYGVERVWAFPSATMPSWAETETETEKVCATNHDLHQPCATHKIYILSSTQTSTASIWNWMRNKLIHTESCFLVISIRRKKNPCKSEYPLLGKFLIPMTSDLNLCKNSNLT